MLAPKHKKMGCTMVRRTSREHPRTDVHPYTYYSLPAEPGRPSLRPQVSSLSFATGVVAASENKEISVMQELSSDF